METTRLDLTELDKLADELLKLGMEASGGNNSYGGYLAISFNTGHFTVQHFDARWWKTKEEAALDWLRWKLQGKI